MSMQLMNYMHYAPASPPPMQQPFAADKSFFSSKYATFWFGKFGSIAQKTKIKTETLSALYIFFAQMLPVETVLPFQMRRESNFQVLLSGIWQEMKNRRNRIMLIHCRGQHKAELVTIDSPAGSCLSCCYQVQ
jgi:hypothetical protein